MLAPYYLLMHAWTAVAGTSGVALRVPSVLAMAAVAGVVARIGGELVTPRAGLLAGLVLCATPAASRTAQEARPYAFAMLAAAAATLLLVRALRAPSTTTWVWYGIALAVSGYVHLFAFTTLAVASASLYPRVGWIGGGLAVALLAAGAVVHTFAVRYLPFTLVSWAVLIGAGLATSARPARWVSVALIAVLSLPAQEAIREVDGHVDVGAPSAAGHITVHLRPGDGIVYQDVSWLRAAMDYHLPAGNRPRDVLLERSATERGGYVAAECADPAACLTGVPRLWLVHQDADPPL